MPAPGNSAIAICDRCKMKMKYTALRADGNSPGLRVCNECWDEKDRWRLPRKKEKPISLRYPRPDVALTNAVVLAPVPPTPPVLNNNWDGGDYWDTAGLTWQDGIIPPPPNWDSAGSQWDNLNVTWDSQ